MSFGMEYGNKYEKEGIQYHNSINGERYVYYKRLNKDRFKDKKFEETCRKVYRRASELAMYRFSVGADAQKIAEYFKELRDNEYAKEKKLLKEKLESFKDFSYTYDDEEIGNFLIKGINELLNFKEVFNRNFELITNTKGNKQIITFFDYYFDKAFHKKEFQDNIINRIETLMKSNSLEDSIRQSLNENIPDIVRSALEFMFTQADAEKGIDNDKYKQAYNELAPYLKKGNKMGDVFVAGLIDSYGLDDIISRLKDLTLTKENYKKMLKSTSFELGSRAKMIRGGSASENLGVFIADVVANEILKLNNSNVTWTGGTKQKSDFIISFDMDTSIVSDWVEKNTFGTREKDVSAMYELQKKLEGIDEGFLVMSNAKNYTLNKNFDGFSAGEKIDLEKWDTMMHQMHLRGRDLIFMVNQTMKGAVAESEKEKISDVFARAISSALFDDISILSQPVKKRGTQVIHVLYLNGIYIPISFYFNLLYKAFGEYSKDEIRKLVTVNINSPKEILWPTQRKENAWKKKHPGESPWNYQSHTALEQTTIEYHFFKSFKKEMENLKITL